MFCPLTNLANDPLTIRCDNSGENKRAISRLASVRCPGGLAFDIERQTCDWKTNVKNCHEVESKFDVGLNAFFTVDTGTGHRVKRSLREKLIGYQMFQKISR